MAALSAQQNLGHLSLWESTQAWTTTSVSGSPSSSAKGKGCSVYRKFANPTGKFTSFKKQNLGFISEDSLRAATPLPFRTPPTHTHPLFLAL